MWKPLRSGKTETSIHLLVLRALLYGCAALLLVVPLATCAGVLSSLFASVTAVVLSAYLANSRLRLPVIAGASFIVFLVGLNADRMLGGVELPVRLLGVQFMCGVIDGVMFGLMTLGAVVLLRTLATRISLFAIVEAVVIGVPPVLLFAGHREMRLGQPRFLSDWANVNGFDPVFVLMALGLLTLTAVALTLVRLPSSRKMSAVLLTLFLLLAFGLWIITLVPAKLLIADSPPGAENTRQQGKNEFQKTRRRKQGQSSRRKSTADKHGGNAKPNPADDDRWPPPPMNGKQGRPVAVVLLHEDFEIYEGCWYFRQNALSQFNGVRLVRASADEMERDVPSAFPTKSIQVADVQLPRGMYKIIPTTVNLLVEQPRPLCLTNPIQLRLESNPNPNYFRVSYSVTSRILTNPLADGEPSDLYAQLALSNAGSPTWSKRVRNHYLSCPSDTRYRALAKQIIGKTILEQDLRRDWQGSPLVRALALKRWLEKNTIYSHDPGHGQSTNPAAEYLFGNRRGYCVHTAHAMVYLLRSIGIPARAALGYMVPASRAGRSSSILIQSTDAHAWPEIYLAGVGWVVVDVSHENIDPNTELPRGPDPQTTRLLANKARQRPIDPHQDRLVDDSRAAMDLRWIWVLFVVVTASFYAVKTWRRLVPCFGPVDQLYRLCYRDVLDRLAEVGMTRRFGETREQFANRVSSSFPDMPVLTHAHLRRAVGDIAMHRRNEWLMLTRRVAGQIAAVNVWWRRWIGALNPVSWLWVR